MPVEHETDRLIVLHPARWNEESPEEAMSDRLKGTSVAGFPVLLRLWHSDSAVLGMATRGGTSGRETEVYICAFLDGFFVRVPKESIAAWAYVHATTTLSTSHVEGLIEQAMRLAEPVTPKDSIASRLGRLMLGLGALRESLTVFRARRP